MYNSRRYSGHRWNIGQGRRCTPANGAEEVQAYITHGVLSKRRDENDQLISYGWADHH